jgi:RPA family protein
MPLERMTAIKVKISDLMSGQWIKKEGMEPSFVVTKDGENVSRARIMATIVGKFISEDGNFGSVTLDDGSDTIRAKCFKDLNVLQPVEIGKFVDLIGKVREYNDEIYIIPEIIRNVDDPNLELLRRLEIMHKIKNLEKQPRDTLAEKLPEKDKEDLRKKILDIIGSSKDGIEYGKLIEASGAPEAEVEKVINDLLAEGICYEPTPGKVRKI